MPDICHHKGCVNSTPPTISFNSDENYDIRIYKMFSLDGQYSKAETISSIRDIIYSDKESINDRIKLTSIFCKPKYCWFSCMWDTITYYEKFIEHIDTVIENYKTNK